MLLRLLRAIFGSVSGQSLLGMKKMRQMMLACKRAGVRLRVWPFDGLNLRGDEYNDCHLAIELYPTAIRPADVSQTDSNDALHSAEFIQEMDLEGRLLHLLDLNDLDPASQNLAKPHCRIFSVLLPSSTK